MSVVTNEKAPAEATGELESLAFPGTGCMRIGLHRDEVKGRDRR